MQVFVYKLCTGQIWNYNTTKNTIRSIIQIFKGDTSHHYISYFFILSSYIPSIDNNATANDIQMGWLKESFTRQKDTACVYIFRRQSASLSLGRAAA